MKTIETIDLAALSNIVGGKNKQDQNICIGWCPGANGGSQTTTDKKTQKGGVKVDPNVNLSPLPAGEST